MVYVLLYKLPHVVGISAPCDACYSESIGKKNIKMYAVIETGGKQYRVNVGDTIYVEKLKVEDGSDFSFDKVIAVGKDDGIVVGAPYVDGATVSAKVIKSGKSKKITVFTYKPKKDSKRKIGHRQPYTKLEIKAINA